MSLNAEIADLLFSVPKCKQEPESNEVVAADIQEFPTWAMTGLAGSFATLYSEYLESCREFFFFSFLTTLGGLILDRVKLHTEIKVQPRLYTVLIGESGDDRKSTAADKTIEFFRESLTDGFNVCYGVSSAEGLQSRFSKCQPRSLLLFFDEFKAFIGKCKLDGSILLPCVNTLFESNRYESHTKGSSIILDGVYLSIIAATTRATFESMWTSTFTDIGFNNRLLLVPGTTKRRFAIPRPIPTVHKEVIKKALGKLLLEIGNCHRMDIEEDGRRLFESWYLDLEQSIHAKRIDTLALRLMLLLTINEGKKSVDLDIVRKAIALANWQLEIRKILDPIDADSSAAKMEEKLRRTLRRGPSSIRDLKQLCNANRTGLWIFDTALKNLQRAGEVTYDSKNKLWIPQQKV